MTEADPSAPSNTSSEHPTASLTADLAAGLSADDIVSGVYEGGFKTWECAADLARFVLGHLDAACSDGLWAVRGRDVHVIEVRLSFPYGITSSRLLTQPQLGAGTALPSSSLLAHFLAVEPTLLASNVHFTIADYNPPVLHLATLPNLFLTALSARSLLLPESDSSALDIEPSPSLVSALRSELRKRNVSIDLVCGAWGTDFVEMICRTSRIEPDPLVKPLVLILASETIYAPSSLYSFARTVVELLRKKKNEGSEALAFVIAKRVYFGVGGGVLEFERVLADFGGRIVEVWGSEGGGVGRCIVEVLVD